MIVASKPAMYRLWDKDAFGNRLRDWGDVGDLLASGFRGKVGVRDTKRTGNPLASLPNVPASEVPDFLRRHGATGDGLRILEGAPDEHQTIQGEVSEMPGGLYVRYAASKMKMREAMASPGVKHARGLDAHLLLRRHLSPASYDDLLDLLDLYPGAVVEFTAFDRPVGRCRTRNAVVWEVRHY